MCLLSARLSCSSSLTTGTSHTLATCFLPPLCHWEVFFKRSRDQTESENACLAFIWQPCILNPFKRGCRGKKGEKIGHVSHNLCSVNFPAHALTVYRVLRISNLRLLFSVPPHPTLSLKPQSLLYFFLPPPSHFLWLMLFWFFFFQSFLCH